MSDMSSNQTENSAQLKVHEWLAVAVLIGIVAALTLITSYTPPSTDFGKNIHKEGIEVFVKGAVANPGVYRFPAAIPMQEILVLAQVKASADLRHFKPEQIVKKGRVLNIPTRHMITVHVKGAVKENVVLNVPKGMCVEEIGDKIALADNADKKFLQKKRRLKDQEVLIVPTNTPKSKK